MARAYVTTAPGRWARPIRHSIGRERATWKLPRSAPKDQEKLSITVSLPVTQGANFRGGITWAKPAPKTGPSTDVVNIAPAPL
jgi:hypothetical protein